MNVEIRWSHPVENENSVWDTADKIQRRVLEDDPKEKVSIHPTFSDWLICITAPAERAEDICGQLSYLEIW